MKKVMMLLVVFGLLFGVTSVFAGKDDNNGNPFPGAKAAVCHFPGHEGDTAWRLQDPAFDRKAWNCENEGGTVIIVGARAVPAHVELP